MKLEVLATTKSTSKSSLADSAAKKLHLPAHVQKLEAVPEDEATSLPMPGKLRQPLSPLPPLSQNIIPQQITSTHHPISTAADPLAELRDLLGPIKPLTTTAVPTMVPPPLPVLSKDIDPRTASQNATVRTNWATFPHGKISLRIFIGKLACLFFSKDIRQHPPSYRILTLSYYPFSAGTSSQSVVLTKFQVSSGSVSVPAARCHSVLGKMEESCTVKLLDARNGTAYQISYKLYPSQPTQVFLQRLKAFFKEAEVKPGDVLSLATVKRGVCQATVYPCEHPLNLEFRTSLPHGWSEVVPTDKRPDGELNFNFNADFMLYEGGIEESRGIKPELENEEFQPAAAPNVRERPLRKVSPRVPFGADWNSGSTTNAMRSTRKKDQRRPAQLHATAAAPKNRLGAKPIRKVGRPRKPVKYWDDSPIAEAENADMENYAPQRRAAVGRKASAQKFLDGKRKRDGASATGAIGSTAQLPFSIPATIPEEEDPDSALEEALLSQVRVKVTPTNQPVYSPPVAQSEARRPRTGTVQGRVKEGGDTGYAIQRRSVTAKLEVRRLRRKGTPTRAPEGEPNILAYGEALALLDSGRFTLF